MRRQRAAIGVIGLAMVAGSCTESFDGKYAILAISAVTLGFLHALP